MKSSGNTILITGGGSGIGAGLAQHFHDLGNHVIVAGRRLAMLDAAIAGRERMSAMQLDVEDVASIKTFCRDVVRLHPALNVLINNAGIMRFETLDQSRDLGDAEATVAANLLGPIRMIDGLVEHLRRQDDAAIVNVTSGLAFVPMIDAATYSATKAAIHSYTVSLREILDGSVEVIELAPPAVQTDLTPGQSSREGYMPLDAFVAEVIGQFQQDPTPKEIVVDRAMVLRSAEAEGRFDDTLQKLNQFARSVRD